MNSVNTAWNIMEQFIALAMSLVRFSAWRFVLENIMASRKLIMCLVEALYRKYRIENIANVNRIINIDICICNIIIAIVISKKVNFQNW